MIYSKEHSANFITTAQYWTTVCICSHTVNKGALHILRVQIGNIYREAWNTYTGHDGPHSVYLQLTAQPIVKGL